MVGPPFFVVGPLVALGSLWPPLIDERLEGGSRTKSVH